MIQLCKSDHLFKPLTNKSYHRDWSLQGINSSWGIDPSSQKKLSRDQSLELLESIKGLIPQLKYIDAGIDPQFF